MSDQKDQPFDRPLYGGHEENLPSGLVPDRTVPRGRQIQLKPLDPAIHTDDLYEASHTMENGPSTWAYLPEGPWPDREAYRASLRGNAGMQESFIDMHPGNSVIEISYIWFAPSMQRTRVATEEMYLMLEHAMT